MINALLEWSLKNRFLVIVGWCLLAAWGLYAMLHTPIDAIPDLSEKQVVVYADWMGRSPQEVEDQVTYPLTTNLQGLAGVKTVRSTSMFGFSMINVIFEEHIDLYFAQTRVLERLRVAEKLLPAGVIPMLGPDATGVGQILWYTVEGSQDPSELRTLQDYYVRFQLSSVQGVAEVASIGGFVKEYQVELDPLKLAAYQLSPREVAMALEQSNQNVGAKVIEAQGAEVMVRGIGLIRSLEDLQSVVVRAAQSMDTKGNPASSASVDGMGSSPPSSPGERLGSPVLLQDVATVSIGPAFRRGILDKDGQEAVGGVVVMRAGESASTVIERVKQKIHDLQPGLPAGVKIVPFYDRSELISRAIQTLRDALLEELVLVTLAHILFLAHFRSILIVTLPLPLAILISFLLMHYFGISSNIMSLGGIAIAIGVLVDAGIVVTENVIRHAEQANDDSKIFQTTLLASRRVVRPIFFSMAIIILAFVPVFALSGQEGKLFHPLAFTKTFAMIGATALALTLVPVLCTFLVRGPYHAEAKNPVMRGLTALYRPTLAWALRHRFVVLATALGLLVTAVGVGSRLGSEFMPPLEEGDLLFMPVTSPAISLTQAQVLLQTQDRILQQFPEVRHVVGKAGRAETATDPAPISMFETVVALKPHSEWRPGMTREKLVRELDAATRLPGVTNIWTQPIINRIDMLATGIRTEVGVKVFGPDLATLERLAAELKQALAEVPGVADLYAEQITGAPYLEVEVDRAAAARVGLTVAEIQDTLTLAVGGMPVTRVIEGRARFDVQVRYARAFREDVTRVGEALIPLPGGGYIPLGQVSTIKMVRGPSMINSENGMLRAYVLMNVRGRDVGSFVKEATATALAKVKPPPGYFWEFSGQFEHQLRAKATLQIVVPIVFLIIFLLLFLVYGSFKEAAHVILAVPFALTGGVLLQAMLGYNFSVAVWVGFIALFGTAVQTGVIMVIYLEEAVKRRYDAALAEGRPFTRAELVEGVMEGALLRLRPKVMTVSTVVAGLIPLFWSDRTGAEVMQPLATPVLGGMVSSLLHVLIVTPVIFLWLRERELARGALTFGSNLDSGEPGSVSAPSSAAHS